MSLSNLALVDSLSDEETQAVVPKASAPCHMVPARRPGKRNSDALVARPSTLNSTTLRHRVQGKCGCRCLCFIPFRVENKFQELVKVRKTLEQLEKVEQDNYVQP